MIDLDSLEVATRSTIERALAAYLECALWASYDEDGVPLDLTCTPGDISEELREQSLEDVYGFLCACWGDVWEDFSIDLSALEPEQIGHDLWLTRNGHGAGFWDRGLGEVGQALTDLSKPYGEVDLFVVDGKVCAL